MTDEPWAKIAALQSAVRYGGSSLRNVPKLIEDVCSGDPALWREFTPPGMTEPVTHDTFTGFVEAEPPRGLGATVELVKRIVTDGEAVRLLDGEAPELAKHGEVGRGRTKDRVDNINSKGGTSPDYALARLKRDRPDLAQQVVNGELSANAAAVKAGFRTPTVSIRVDPESAARTIRRKFTPEQIAQLKELL